MTLPPFYLCAVLAVTFVTHLGCVPERPRDQLKGGEAKLQASEQQQKPVAKVETRVLTRGEVEHRLRDLEAFKSRVSTKEQRRDFLNAYVTMLAMAQDARKRGLEGTNHRQAIVAHVDAHLAQRQADRVLASTLEANPITEQDLRKAYDPANYKTPKRWQVVRFQVLTQELARELRERLEKIEPLEQRLSQAKQLSGRHTVVTEVARQQGQVAVEKTDTGDFAQVVQELSAPGEMTSLIQAEGTWQFAVLVRIQSKRQKTFQEVESELRTQLVTTEKQRAKDKWLERLRQKHEPTLNTKALEQVSTPRSVLAAKRVAPFE